MRVIYDGDPFSSGKFDNFITQKVNKEFVELRRIGIRWMLLTHSYDPIPVPPELIDDNDALEGWVIATMRVL